MIRKGNFRVHLQLHSVNPVGDEAITFSHTHERAVHADFMTHRVSRNASSSRAIPWGRMKDWTQSDPAMPLHLGSNRSGMQSGPEIDDPAWVWRNLEEMAGIAFQNCEILHESGLHKEIVNRYIEPWGWINVVSTWSRPTFMNFLALRATAEAEPRMQRLAVSMAREYRASIPVRLQAGEWHLPFVDPENFAGIAFPISDERHSRIIVNAMRTWSVARCAWTSYQTVEGKEATYADARRRHDACVDFKHVTPCEHQKRARADHGRNGGTTPGFDEYRHMIPGESTPEIDIDALLDGPYRDRDFILPHMIGR